VINLEFARISNDLLVVAVLAYTLAMIGYGAEFSFGRRKAAAVPGVVSRGERLGRLAVSLTLFGWAAHLGSVVTRGLAAHRTPWGNMYEFSCAVTLAAVTVFLVALIKHKLRYLGAFVMLPVVVTLGVAGTLLYSKAEPLQPALQSYWLKIHVTAAITAWGVFMVGAVQTVLYLMQERRERGLVVAEATQATVTAAAIGGGGSAVGGSVAVLTGGGSHRADGSRGARGSGKGSFLERLPSADALDAAAYKTIAFGFPIWTFAIICGSIWAEKAWGRAGDGWVAGSQGGLRGDDGFRCADRGLLHRQHLRHRPALLRGAVGPGPTGPVRSGSAVQARPSWRHSSPGLAVPRRGPHPAVGL
jgi:cytochrome c-type biogenesis protein CcsB